MIDLFMTLDAVEQQMANVAEMLTVERPDLMPNSGMDLGGDLLVLSWLWVDPQFRGHMIGHAILKAILGNRRQECLAGCTPGRPGPHR